MYCPSCKAEFIDSITICSDCNITLVDNMVLNESLENINKVFDEKLPWDFWTIDLRQAINYLGELTGEDLTENLLDNIFSKFCIGK